MQQILKYIKEYYNEEFRFGYFIIILIFLAISLFINYRYDFEKNIILSSNNRFILFLNYYVFYAVPYYFSIIVYSLYYKKYDFLKIPNFWLLSMFGISLLALDMATDVGLSMVINVIPFHLSFWFLRSLNNLIQALVLFIPPMVYWYFSDRKKIGLYGFTTKNFQLSPYFIMLLIMAPFIFFVSFRSDFLSMYPRYRPLYIQGTYLPVITQLSFEFFYAMAFASVEFLFRGFFVIGLMKYLKRGAIIPMAALYCFIHFQKPFLEAASSIFGGLLLGIISSYSYSIYGGIIAHIGIAWMMELTALFQIYVLNKR